MKLLDIAVLDSGSVMVFVFADGRDHDALAVHRVKRQVRTSNKRLSSTLGVELK